METRERAKEREEYKEVERCNIEGRMKKGKERLRPSMRLIMKWKRKKNEKERDWK